MDVAPDMSNAVMQKNAFTQILFCQGHVHIEKILRMVKYSTGKIETSKNKDCEVKKWFGKLQ